MRITKALYQAMCLSLEKSVAVYELLHSHAKGQTDLTEDQLANVVTGVAMEARETLGRARGPHDGPYGPAGWVGGAQDRTSRAGRRMHD